MKAAINSKYGAPEVVQIKDIPRPEIGAADMLVQVHAAAITTADWRIRAAAFPPYAWLIGRLMFGLRKPRRKVLGTDFSGIVSAVGDKVGLYKVGDAVFGFSGHGAHAEYLAIPEDGALTVKPDNLSHINAAAVPFGAMCALVFLRDFAKLRPGQKVLVNGASGGIGVFAVQLAKYFGAHVTGVCSSANQALVASLGADRVIDYTAEDVAQGSAKYDLILDPIGALPFRKSKRMLTRSGIYLPIEFNSREIFQALRTKITGGRRVVIGISGDSHADMELLAGLLKDGHIRAVVDGVFPLEDIVAGHRRVDSRHKRGSVVVSVAPGQTDMQPKSALHERSVAHAAA